jgi:ectoine hydroxylase-related dioxygenase (phytanoyl-CoA dioxygenase family)
MSETSTDLKRHPWNQTFEWSIPSGPYRAITQEQADQFDRDGFVVLPDIFDAETVAAVTAELDKFEAEMEAFLQKQPDGRAAIGETGAITFTAQLIEKSDILRRFATRQIFLDLCLDLLGPDVNTYWDQAVYKKPEKPRRFPWHQDNGYTYLKPQHYLTCWVPMVDATPDNGCPVVAPGLHRMGTLQHHYVDPLGFECLTDYEGTAAPAGAGSIVVFSSLTPHLTGPNMTDKVRKAYILQYAPTNAMKQIGNPSAGPPTSEAPCLDFASQFPILKDGTPVDLPS